MRDNRFIRENKNDKCPNNNSACTRAIDAVWSMTHEHEWELDVPGHRYLTESHRALFDLYKCVVPWCKGSKLTMKGERPK